MDSPLDEKTFYQDDLVTVTQSRYIANSKTYAMRDISSVSNFKIKRSLLLPIVLTGMGAIALCNDETWEIGLFVVIIGILWFISVNKDEYAVRISTNSGESNSLVHNDEAYIQKIVDALNDAIIHRG